MDDIRKIIESTKPILWDIAAYLPRILIALVVLFFGWMVARLLKRFVVRVLRFMRMEEAAERLGIDSFLLQGGVRYTSVTLVAEIFYWFLIFSIILFALNILGVSDAGIMFSRIINYVPKVLIGMLILIFGSLIARFIHALLFAYLDNIGIQGANTMSALGQYAILAFVIFVTLEQLSIGGEFLEGTFQIAFGALALAFGIAFGLGGKEVAKDFLERAINSRTKERK